MTVSINPPNTALPSRRIERWRILLGRLSLRTRVRGMMALVTVVSVLFVVLSVTFFVYRIEQDVWRARQQEAAHGATNRVEAFLRQVEQSLMMIAYLDPVYLEDHAETLPTLLEMHPALIEILRLDGTGEVIASAYNTASPVLANTFTIPQSSWFLAALQGSTYLGDVQLDANGEPYLIISAPTHDGGAIATRLDMTLLWEVVNQVGFGETGQSYVVNQNGYIVAHPDQSVVTAQTIIADRPEVQAALTQTMFSLAVRDTLAADADGSRPSPPEGSETEWRGTYTNFQGKMVQGMALPILGSGWIILTEVTRSEATSATQLAALTMTGSLFVLGIVIYFFLVISLQFIALTPLEIVRNGAFRMGQGHLDERIPIETQDEIGALAREFNHMAGNLQQTIKETELLAQKANEANAFKSNLISRVSHELRNPLGGVLGISEMVQLGVFGPISEEQEAAMSQIVVSAEYLTKLVGELLEQSRLERGRVALDITRFDPQAVIERIVKISQPAADEKGIDLVLEADDNLPSLVILDQGKLEQVIANLVSNAVKFTQTGEVRVKMQSEDHEYWSIRVTDTGIGIPKEAQDQVFEPFRQVDESITRQYGGFGLGLSIVSHLTALMEGSITLESEVGQGSCFTIRLPYSLLGKAQTKPLAPEDVPAHVDLTAATHPLTEGVVLK
ncbi:MAG: sensor histidine kinase [Anaerolineae bacterium]|nr:sensor histidine kinase [Anaerolineae bacterium]